MTAPLQTLLRPGRHEITIDRSRFITQAFPVDTPQLALDTLARARDDDASHNCWAYRIGDAYRSSDDGEPAGTAGRPILAAIDGQGIDRVLVVVTRWFGGIKLGAGGLVRAYGGGAAECLRLADRQPIVAMSELSCLIDFGLEPALRALLPAMDGNVLAHTWTTDGARLVIRLPSDREDALRTRLIDLSRGRAQLDPAS